MNNLHVCFLKGAAVWRSGQQQGTIATVHDISPVVGISDVSVKMHSVNVESPARQPLLFHLLEHPHVDFVDCG